MGASGQSLAAELRWSQSKVSRLEAGKVRPTIEDIEELLDMFKPPEARRGELLELASVAAERPSGWWNDRRSRMTRRQREFAAFEASAVLIRHFQPVFIPGLLQTPDYARAILERINAVMPLDVDAAIGYRMVRQSTLSARPTAPRYETIVYEAALWYCPDAEAEDVRPWQLSHMAEMSKRKNIEVRVIPREVAPGYPAANSFYLYSFAGEDTPPVGLVETVTADFSITVSEDLDVYDKIWGRLQGSALNAARSRELIESVARSLGAGEHDGERM
jgi:transcriptional regulator with XRE-family HTH domain